MTRDKIFDELDDKLDAFFAERVESKQGGWAEVSYEDQAEIILLFDAILRAKYEADADGDLPIEFKIINRNFCQRMHFCPQPYPRLAGDDIKKIIAQLRTANMNLGIAQGEVDRLVGYLDYLTTREDL
jgi:hypothetical protein